MSIWEGPPLKPPALKPFDIHYNPGEGRIYAPPPLVPNPPAPMPTPHASQARNIWSKKKGAAAYTIWPNAIEGRRFYRDLKDYLATGILPKNANSRRFILRMNVQFPSSRGYKWSLGKGSTVADQVDVTSPTGERINVHLVPSKKPPVVDYQGQYVGGFFTTWNQYAGLTNESEGRAGTSLAYAYNIGTQTLEELKPVSFKATHQQDDNGSWWNKEVEIRKEAGPVYPSPYGFFKEAPKGFSLDDYRDLAIALDTETGFAPTSNRKTAAGGLIVNVGMVVTGVHNKTGEVHVLDFFQRYYNPGATKKVQRNYGAESVTGLSPDVLNLFLKEHPEARGHSLLYENQQDIDDVMNFIRRYPSAAITGQNIIDFDLKYLFPGNAYWGYRQEILERRKIIDSLDIARAFRPAREGYNTLGTLFRLFTGKTMEQAGLTAHGALPDALGSAAVYYGLENDAAASALIQMMKTGAITYREVPRFDKGQAYIAELDDPVYLNQFRKGMESSGGDMNNDTLIDTLNLFRMGLEASTKDLSATIGHFSEDLSVYLENTVAQKAMAKTSLVSRLSKYPPAQAAEIVKTMSRSEEAQRVLLEDADVYRQIREEEEAKTRADRESIQAYKLRRRYRDAPEIAERVDYLPGLDNPVAREAALTDIDEDYSAYKENKREAQRQALRQQRELDKQQSIAEREELRRYKLERKFRGNDEMSRRLADIYATTTPGLEREEAIYDLMEDFKDLSKTTKDTTAGFLSMNKLLGLLSFGNGAADFSQVAAATNNQLSGIDNALKGVLPDYLHTPISRLIKSGQNQINMWGEKARVGRVVANNVADAAGAITGVATMNPIVGQGVTTGINMIYGISQFPKEYMQYKATMFGEEVQRKLNLLGAVNEIVLGPIRLFGNALKGLARGMLGLLNSGMNYSLQYGTPWTPLTQVGMSDYARSRLSDAAYGLQMGSTNASLNKWSVAQMGLYTLGQVDTTRLVSAAMLGQFGNVYSFGGNAQNQYAAFINSTYQQIRNAANDEERQRIMYMAGNVDENALQILSRMDIINRAFGTNLSYEELSNPSRWRVYSHPLSEQERAASYVMNYQWGAQKEQFGSSVTRLAMAAWNHGGNSLATLGNQTLDVMATAISGGDWRGAFNELGKSLRELGSRAKEAWKGLKDSGVFDDVRAGLSEAWTSLKPTIFTAIKEIAGFFINTFWDAVDAIQKNVGELFAQLGYYELKYKNGTFSIVHKGQAVIERYKDNEPWPEEWVFDSSGLGIATTHGVTAQRHRPNSPGWESITRLGQIDPNKTYLLKRTGTEETLEISGADLQLFSYINNFAHTTEEAEAALDLELPDIYKWLGIPDEHNSTFRPVNTESFRYATGRLANTEIDTLGAVAPALAASIQQNVSGAVHKVEISLKQNGDLLGAGTLNVDTGKFDWNNISDLSVVEYVRDMATGGN